VSLPDYSPWLWIWRDPCIPIDGGRSPLKMQEILKYTRKVHPAPSTRAENRGCVNCLTIENVESMQPRIEGQ